MVLLLLLMIGERFLLNQMARWIGISSLTLKTLVWMYAFTSSASSASLISELTTENGGTDAPHIRIANWDGLS